MSFALETVVGSSLVLAVGLALLLVVRRQSAASRHWLLAAALMCAVLQPVLNRVMPAWTISPQWITMPRSSVADPAPAVSVSSVLAEAVTPVTPVAQSSLGLVDVLLVIWSIGVAAGVGALLVGVVWLLWLGRRSSTAGANWLTCACEMRAAIGLRREVRVRITPHPALLVTWGIVHPVILLPADADTWPDDRVRLVLAHELAHVVRRDWLVQFTAECARAINWFNPLFWIACARLRRESEQACDDTVLDLGIDPAAYASHLVVLARAFSLHGRTWLPAPSIARPSTLERRVRAMLNPQVVRRPMSLVRRMTVVAVLLAATMPIAIAASQTRATVTGKITDPSGLPLPDATVRAVAVAGGAAIETKTDSTGAFQLSDVPLGEYMFSTRYPGFSSQRQRIRISGDYSVALRAQVGKLSETVTVKHGDPVMPDKPALALPGAPPCGSTSVGGNLKPPRKLRNVSPHYRQAWVGAGVEGNVLLEARIGTDGRVRSVEVVSPSNAELEDEAMAAVSQWEFSPTYLNCEAVEVRMFVTVSFKAE